MNYLRIEQMTVFDVDPAEVITIAAELDVPYVSLWTVPGMSDARPVTTENKQAVMKQLRHTGVRVDTIEVFPLTPEPQKYQAAIELSAELGARSIVTINMEPEEGRAAEQYVALCEMAGKYGVNVSLEPIWMGVTRTVAQAEKIVRQSGVTNGRITVDLLHIMRTNSELTDVSALDYGLIGSAQICDGPAQIDPEYSIEEAAHERMVPGEGVFPLVDFLLVIPDDVVVGIEVPLRSRRESGMSALERSRLVVNATRTVQALVSR